jgi:hypothetical protein
MKKQPKRKRLWLVRNVNLNEYDIVESDGVPWLTGGHGWWVTSDDGRVACIPSGDFDRAFPHLKLAEGECCEIEVREVVR